jgi:hypothetical protein
MHIINYIFNHGFFFFEIVKKILGILGLDVLGVSC